MIKFLKLLSACAVCFFSFITQVFSQALPDEIDKVLREHRILKQDISLVVQAVDEDLPRIAFNSEIPRNPASVIKVVTSWAALDLLGPTFNWVTKIYALGPIKNGVLEGDLVVKGGGDPYLTLDEFWRMLGELRRNGLHTIKGDLVFDDSLYNAGESDLNPLDGESYHLYNVSPHPFLVNFKAIDFVINPIRNTGQVDIKTVPHLPNLVVTNNIKLTRKPCRGSGPRIIMTQAKSNSPDHIVLSGRMPRSCKNYRLGRTAMTHASYAYGVFKTLWSQWGGSLQGSFRTEVLKNPGSLLLSWKSRPLAEIIRPLNKWSNNVMTRMLLLTVAETKFNPPVDREKGVITILEHLQKIGVDTNGLQIENGSGLSRKTRVSATQMTELLRLAWVKPHMPEFVASLSIGGQDGTTRKRFRRSRVKGNSHLKTGSLKDVSSVTGYMHNDRGKTFTVTLIINSPAVKFGAGRAVQDATLDWVLNQR